MIECGQLTLRTVVLSKKNPKPNILKQLLQAGINFTACLPTCLYGELSVEPNSCFSVLKLEEAGLCNIHLSLF